jgi:hypothetical protein
MTAFPTARRKAIRSDAAHRSATTRCVPLRLTLGSQQPPGNASTPFALVQLSSNARPPVAATQSCSANAPSQRRLLPPNPHRARCTAAAH